MTFDANGDGKLARTEVPERMQGLFDRADANKDGVLTSDELTKLADAQQQTAAQGERRGEFGRGGPGGPGEPGGASGRGMRLDRVMQASQSRQITGPMTPRSMGPKSVKVGGCRPTRSSFAHLDPVASGGRGWINRATLRIRNYLNVPRSAT